MDGQTSRGRRARDQVDDHLVTDERLPPPVLADKGKQAVFDLVPLAGSRRQMTDRNPQTGLVGLLL